MGAARAIRWDRAFLNGLLCALAAGSLWGVVAGAWLWIPYGVLPPGLSARSLDDVWVNEYRVSVGAVEPIVLVIPSLLAGLAVFAITRFEAGRLTGRVLTVGIFWVLASVFAAEVAIVCVALGGNGAASSDLVALYPSFVAASPWALAVPYLAALAGVPFAEVLGHGLAGAQRRILARVVSGTTVFGGAAIVLGAVGTVSNLWLWRRSVDLAAQCPSGVNPFCPLYVNAASEHLGSVVVFAALALIGAGCLFVSLARRAHTPEIHP